MSVNGKVDLHFHTECSGDSFIPLYAVAPAAERLGLRAIAKADHDSVTGCRFLMEAARRSKVEVIPAVELSTVEHFHILGYFVDPENAELLKATEREKEYGRTILRLRLAAWQANGGAYRGDLERLVEQTRALRPVGEIGVKTVANVFVGMGLFRNAAEAREDIAARAKGLVLPPHSPPAAAEVIALVKRAGGVAVVAHPSSTAQGEGRPGPGDVIRLVEAGAIGVECYNVSMSADEQAFWEKFCRGRALVCTGGTDCHEYVEEWNVIKETVTGYEAVEGLKAAAGQR